MTQTFPLYVGGPLGFLMFEILEHSYFGFVSARPGATCQRHEAHDSRS